jgi:hypothetical protein
MCYSKGYHSGINVPSVPLHLEFARIGHRRLELDGVDQGLSQSNILDDRIIKPIHIIPDCDKQPAPLQNGQNPKVKQRYEYAQPIFSSL